MPPKFKSKFITIHEDGVVEAFGNKEGSPQITAVIPAPDVNTIDEKERQRRYEHGCDGVILDGFLIISKKMIRNKSFDDPGQTTTMEIVYRPAKTKAELKTVADNFREVLLKLVKNEDTKIRQAFMVEHPEFLEID